MQVDNCTHPPIYVFLRHNTHATVLLASLRCLSDVKFHHCIYLPEHLRRLSTLTRKKYFPRLSLSVFFNNIRISYHER